jgi:hypothetical protein
MIKTLLYLGCNRFILLIVKTLNQFRGTTLAAELMMTILNGYGTSWSSMYGDIDNS